MAYTTKDADYGVLLRISEEIYRQLVMYFNKELNILTRNKVRSSETHTAESLVCEEAVNKLVISVGKVRHRSNYS
jgi:hypothetical protein